MDENEPTEEMSAAACWEMLARHEFGRLAFHLIREVHLVPINYAVREQTLLFRTAPGNKLVGMLMNPDVVFEIDEYDESVASSVVVRGRARRLEEDEQHWVDDLDLHPWIETEKYEVVEITPVEVTGRRFLIGQRRPGAA